MREKTSLKGFRTTYEEAVTRCNEVKLIQIVCTLYLRFDYPNECLFREMIYYPSSLWISTSRRNHTERWFNEILLARGKVNPASRVDPSDDIKTRGSRQITGKHKPRNKTCTKLVVTAYVTNLISLHASVCMGPVGWATPATISRKRGRLMSKTKPACWSNHS